MLDVVLDITLDLNNQVGEDVWNQVALWAAIEFASDVEVCKHGCCRLCHRAEEIELIRHMAIA